MCRDEWQNEIWYNNRANHQDRWPSQTFLETSASLLFAGIIFVYHVMSFSKVKNTFISGKQYWVAWSINYNKTEHWIIKGRITRKKAIQWLFFITTTCCKIEQEKFISAKLKSSATIAIFSISVNSMLRSDQLITNEWTTYYACILTLIINLFVNHRFWD